MNARTSRRLRIVESRTDPARHLVFGHEGYGCKPIAHLPHNPPANEIAIRARAQSLLSRGGVRAELPDYETALKIIAAANRPKRVTVPEPIHNSEESK